MNELVITSQGGKEVTTSLIVAQVFGKEHGKVCRDIESLSCSKMFRDANFGCSLYLRDLPNGGSKQERFYEITKDGFSFLVMGYTGEKAGQFKETFIFEFNKRESLLKSDDYILARSQDILQKRLQSATQQIQMLEGTNELLQEENKALTPKADYTDKVLQSTSTFTLTQAAHALGMRSVHVLTKLLREKKILFYQSGQWQPTAKVADKGYFKPRTSHHTKSDGTMGTTISTVVTEKGREYLHSLIIVEA